MSHFERRRSSRCTAVVQQTLLIAFMVSVVTALHAQSNTQPSSSAGSRPTIDVQSSPYNAKCDGTTDNTAAIASAIKAACVSGAQVFFPGVCVSHAQINIDSSCAHSIRLYGNTTRDGILWSNAKPLEQGIYLNAPRVPVEIDHMMLKGAASPATLGRVLYGRDCSNVNIHDSLVTGGGASVSGYYPYGGLWFQDCDNVTIDNNEFTANGPTSGFPKQGDSDLGTNPFVVRAGVSHDFHILNNRVHGSHTDISFAFNNLGDSDATGNTIDENNTVNHHIPNPTSGGYGIMFYGTGGVRIKSLTRRSNIVTAVTAPNHEAVGDHIRVTSTKSVGGTLFDGDFIILTRPDSTHLTWAQTAADDTTGADGSVNISPQHVTVNHNTVKNTAGSSIYLQSVTDSAVDNNSITDSSQQENPISLCVGGISLTAPMRVTVVGNVISGNTQDGICVSLGVDTTINGNTINGGKNGINMRGYFNSGNITNNKVQGGAVGINVPAGSLLYNSSITENTVSRQTSRGMYFGAAQKSTLGHNTFVPGPTTQYGLDIDSQKFASANNTIKNNVVNGLLPGGAKGFHAAGVRLTGTNHIVEGNTLSNMASDALEDTGKTSTNGLHPGAAVKPTKPWQRP